MTAAPEPESVCAVIIAFHPDSGFVPRLRKLYSQFQAMVVVNNTPHSKEQASLDLGMGGAEKFRLIQNGRNLGVGAALNQGLAQALAWGCRWIVTLDQDSRCYADMVQTLLQVKDRCATQPVVVGGNYYDPRNRTTRVPMGGPGEYLEQTTVITSACLVDAVFAERLGGFRDDYFIDQLDHEFCLRARKHGARILISRKPVMEHSVGEDGGTWLPLFGRLPNHVPVRKYYIARNSIVTIARYWRVEPDWCARRLLRLLFGAALMLLFEERRRQKLKAFMLGIRDGLGHRMGACEYGGLIQK
uniref:glycosyltransferase n=1 Tax=Hylemonella sp. TaxID=2066020 RepID=UPI0035B11407